MTTCSGHSVQFQNTHLLFKLSTFYGLRGFNCYKTNCQLPNPINLHSRNRHR